MKWTNTRQKMERWVKSRTTVKYRETFTERVQEILADRRRWRETKQGARESLARDMKVRPRVIERWERGELKSPRVDWWFRIEEMWFAVQAAKQAAKEHYDETCERLEASARQHNSNGDQHRGG